MPLKLTLEPTVAGTLRSACFNVSLHGNIVGGEPVMCKVEASILHYHVPIKSTLTLLLEGTHSMFSVLLFFPLGG